jgi:hypothetical protein
MLLPHLSKENRAVPFAIEDDDEAAQIRIGRELVGCGLLGYLLAGSGNSGSPRSGNSGSDPERRTP